MKEGLDPEAGQRDSKLAIQRFNLTLKHMKEAKDLAKFARTPQSANQYCSSPENHCKSYNMNMTEETSLLHDKVDSKPFECDYVLWSSAMTESDTISPAVYQRERHYLQIVRTCREYAPIVLAVDTLRTSHSVTIELEHRPPRKRTDSKVGYTVMLR